MPPPTVLVTGALGCIGAWCLYHLVHQGLPVVAFDRSTDTHRLDLLLPPERRTGITWVEGDITDADQLTAAVVDHGVTTMIHLAALQIPFCRADPARGAQVNVTGTVNVFEAARKAGIEHIALASSVAVYGPPERYDRASLDTEAPMDPRTLYGVYKQANEGLAQVYGREHGVGSTVLRPYTVYGVGRDQGLTSDPTKAMLAAAAGQTHHIGFGGSTQLQLASDVAQQFIEAVLHPTQQAVAFNLGGDTLTIDRVVRLIQRIRPGAQITHADHALPFPEHLSDRALHLHAKTVYQTPLARGIRQTIEHFERCLTDGRLTP